MQDQRDIQLIFDPGRGSVGLRAITAVRGDRVGAMPSATRKGYEFLGWFTVPEGHPDGENPEHRVSSQTVVDDRLGEETTLYAHWAKKVREKKLSSLAVQKRAVVALAVAAAILLGSLIFVNYLVEIYHYTDVDGEVYTIKKKDGVYGLYLDGVLCDINDEGRYLTRHGTQLELDAATGEYDTYAIVHTSGTEIVGSNQRVLLFKQLTYDKSSTSDISRVISRIEVHNQHGVMIFNRGDNNRFTIEGHEDAPVSDTLFAQLAVGCGYNLSTRRLENPVRLPDGSVDLDEYGFVPETRTRTDEEGNEETYEYVPTWYKTTTLNGDTYTVTLGDPVVSGGYYAMFTDMNGNGGRDTIYILTSANLDNAVLKPAEALVTPTVIYPMTVSTYFDVENFTYYSNIDYDRLTRDMVFELSGGTLDLDEIVPDPETGKMDPAVTDELKMTLAKMEDMTDEDFKAFRDKHFEANADLITSFTYVDIDKRTNTLFSAAPYVMANDYMDGYLPNADNITSKVLQALYETTYNEVIRLSPTDEELDAYGLLEPAHVISFIYHEPSKDESGRATTVDRYNHLEISEKTEDGLYYIYSPRYDMIVSMDESKYVFLEWDTIDWYEREYYQGNIVNTTDIIVSAPSLEEAIHFELDNSASPVSSDGSPTIDRMKVYANGKLMDYKLMVTKPVDERVQETALYNFQRFYGTLVSASLEETAKLTREEMAALRAKDDSECLLKFAIFLSDNQGNTRYLVYRFYQITERRAYMTLEVLDAPDLSLSNPANAQGLFSVSSSFCKKIVSDVHRFMNGEEIISDNKI